MIQSQQKKEQRERKKKEGRILKNVTDSYVADMVKKKLEREKRTFRGSLQSPPGICSCDFVDLHVREFFFFSKGKRMRRRDKRDTMVGSRPEMREKLRCAVSGALPCTVPLACCSHSVHRLSREVVISSYRPSSVLPQDRVAVREALRMLIVDASGSLWVAGSGHGNVAFRRIVDDF